VYSAGGHGSGVVVGSNLVLTAKHVADHQNDPCGLTIKTHDGTEYKVNGVINDPNSDAALLTIDGEFSVPALLVSCDIPRVGEDITVIGTPYDVRLQNCLLIGRVVKSGVELDDEKNIIMIDAHSGPGCSGGPMLYKGKVIGIVVIGWGSLGGALSAVEFKVDLGL
jgi:S1-C subfamily serine protease